MPVFRELMCAVSCRTFVGHYMSDKVVKKIAHDYYLITAALELVNFPIILPFTKSWYGKKAADMVLDEFAKCAAKSKARMAAGGSVTCIMDAWIQQQQESAKYRAKLAKGIEVPESEKPAMILRDFTDWEVSMTIFTFLFASQDATSSACTWLFQLLADRPEWLAKVREENLRLRNGDRHKRFDMGHARIHGANPRRGQRNPPLPPTGHHGAVQSEKGLADHTRVQSQEGHDGHPLRLARHARPRSLPRPGVLGPRALDHGRRGEAGQELARLRHRPTLLSWARRTRS